MLRFSKLIRYLEDIPQDVKRTLYLHLIISRVSSIIGNATNRSHIKAILTERAAIYARGRKSIISGKLCACLLTVRNRSVDRRRKRASGLESANRTCLIEQKTVGSVTAAGIRVNRTSSHPDRGGVYCS